MALEIVPKPRLYETVYILRALQQQGEADQVAKRVQEVVTRFNGTLVKVDTWGLRRLAYPIGRNKRGVYVYVQYASTGPIVAEMERNLRLSDSVIRFQTVKLEEDVDLEALTVDPESVKFEEVNLDEADDEPSIEEKLGMVARPRQQRSQRDDHYEKGEDGDEIHFYGEDADLQ